jgi:hypothetical protein
MKRPTRTVIVPPDHPGSSRSLPTLVFACCFAAAFAAEGALAKSLPPNEVGAEAPIYQVVTPSGDSIRELWRFVFSWKGLPVGHLTIAGTEIEENGERLMRVQIAGRTNSFIDLLWRYRLEAGGALRLDPIAPATYYAVETESAKQATTRIAYDRTRRVTTFRKKGEKVKEYDFEAPNTYEFLSTIWLLLNVEYELGKIYHVDAITGASRYLLDVGVEEREQVKIDGVSVDTFRLRATTRELTDPNNEIAEKHRETLLWVNTDWPRRLLRADVSTKWGTIRLELTGIEEIADLPSPDHMEASPAPTAESSERVNNLRPFGAGPSGR